MRPPPLPTVGASVLLLLSACWPMLQVELTTREEQLPAPRFIVSDPDHPDRPRYDTILVLDRNGALFWHLRAAPFGDQNSVDRFTYGETLEGFEVVKGPEPLRPGGSYAVFVRGKNRGALHIDVDAQGQVHAVPP